MFIHLSRLPAAAAGSLLAITIVLVIDKKKTEIENCITDTLPRRMLEWQCGQCSLWLVFAFREGKYTSHRTCGRKSVMKLREMRDSV